MHVRRAINLLLQRSHYQIVKVAQVVPIETVPPDSLLNDGFLSARISPQRTHAWVIAAPKTGSTWLSAMLQTLLDWRTVPLMSGYHRSEQEVDVRQMVRFPRENVFSPHQHCRASKSTVDFINRFRVKPIIQVRNLYDSIISFRDHCLSESTIFPMAYIDGEFLRHGEEEQLQFIIDMVVPWYLNFYASWFQVEGLSRENLFFVQYDELLEDPPEVLADILAYLGQYHSPAKIDAAIVRAKGMNTRKNKGMPGRGKLLLSERHMERIMELRQHYPHIDFSRVGLGGSAAKERNAELIQR